MLDDGAVFRQPVLVKRRRIVVRLGALVVGAIAFLRVPFDFGPTPTRPASWTPTAPRAAAAEPIDPHIDEHVESARLRPPAHEPIVYAPSPYRYPGDADAQVHGVANDREALGALLSERLASFEAFGEGAAGRDVLFLLGAEHQGVGDFGRAADFYEAFLAHPEAAECEEGGEGCRAAAASLENAVVFRRALDQPERALTNADLFESRFAATHPRAATRVAFAASELDPDGPIARLERLASRRLPPAEAIQVDVRLGKALWNVDRGAARVAFRRAERRWRTSGRTLMATSPGLDATTWIGELSRTREALAEARLYEARQQFRRAEHMKPPAYRGEPTERRVTRWVERRLRPWMERRLRAIHRAQRALDRVDALGLSRSTVAAAALRGELFQNLADSLTHLDVPSRILPDDETTVSVETTNPPVYRQLIVPAQQHFRACMDMARETRNYGEHSDRCADGLARYESRWRRPVELRPRAARQTRLVHPEAY